jgi:hypothetical protein
VKSELKFSLDVSKKWNFAQNNIKISKKKERVDKSFKDYGTKDFYTFYTHIFGMLFDVIGWMFSRYHNKDSKNC